MPPRFIIGQVLIESLMLLMLALVLATSRPGRAWPACAAALTCRPFSEGLEMVGMSPVIYPALVAGDITAANVIVVVLGVLASLYPRGAHRAMCRLKPLRGRRHMQPHTVVCRQVSKVYRPECDLRAGADRHQSGNPEEGFSVPVRPLRFRQSTLLNLIGGLGSAHQRRGRGGRHCAGVARQGALARLRLQRIGFVFPGLQPDPCSYRA